MRGLKRNYHWVITLVLLLELAVFGGILNNVLSLYIIPVTEELGISRGSFSLAMSIRPFIGFFATLFSGVLLVKFGYRKLVSGFLLAAALGFCLLGAARQTGMLALAAALLGLGEAFCTTPAASRLVNSWFYSRQGTVLGLVSASTGLGGSLFSILMTQVIGRSGWRWSFFLSAILIAATAGLLLLLARDHPSDMGLQPYGMGTHHAQKPRRGSRDHWQGYEARQVLRKPSFYLMALVVFLSCACIYATYSVIVPHLQDRGMGPSDAAAIQSIMLLCLAGAQLLCGFLGDHLGIRPVVLSCMLCCTAGLLLMALVKSFALAVVAAALFSVGVVMTSITTPLLSSALYGYRPQGSILGVFMAMIPASSVIASPIVNSIYDRIGSYTPIFLSTAGLGAVAAVLMLLLFFLADRERKEYEATG